MLLSHGAVVDPGHTDAQRWHSGKIAISCKDIPQTKMGQYSVQTR
jgi:hypothetical protein